MADIKKIKERLEALLTRARDAGSSPAEVQMCMERAQRLMEQYGITEGDLKDEDNLTFRDYEINVKDGQTKHDPVVRYCAPSVGKLTSVTFYIKGSPQLGEKAPIIAVGLDADVEYAMWLLTSLRTFMDDQWRDYRDWHLEACTRDELKAERVGFIRGFCNEVNSRMSDMVRAYQREHAGGVATGTDLIVRKNDLVKQHLADRGINLGRGKVLHGRGYGSASGAVAGTQAGQAANIGRGVGQSHAAIGKA